MSASRDEGFAVLPLVLSVVLGAVLAVVASMSLVASQTATPDPVNKPLITYDAS